VHRAPVEDARAVFMRMLAATATWQSDAYVFTAPTCGKP
jgi:hypothetical protein